MTALLSTALAGSPPAEVLLAMARLSPNAVVLVARRDDESDLSYEIVWANPSFDRLVGCRPGQLVGAPLGALGARLLLAGQDDTADRPVVGAVDAISELLAGGGGSAELTLRRADGSLSATRLSAVPLIADGVTFWMLDVSEIDRELRADQDLHASEARFQALASNAPIGIFSSEVGLRLAYVNERCAELWGRPVVELLGTGWLNAIDPEDLEAALESFGSVLAGSEIDITVRIRQNGSEPKWLRIRAVPVQSNGRGAGLVGSVEDITADKRHEAELAHQATHDPLTGLPNRTMLWQELTRLVEGRRRDDRSSALLFFDLDNFKLVNDSLGHAAGDELLIRVATRLKTDLRAGDLLARLGGDEFVVLCAEVSTEAEAVAIADRMLRSVGRPTMLGESEVRVTASVGVVMVDRSITAAEAIMRDADVAMYQAKGAGKARAAVFEERARSMVQDRLALVTDLRRAVERDELDIVYQPVYDLRSKAVVSVEALVRWLHPTRGPVAARDIVSLAEETGTILEVGTWVLRHATRQLASWRRALGGAAPGYVAVNLSARQLSADLVDLVEQTLSESGLLGSDLCLELTESVLMGDTVSTLGVLSDLRDMGVHLAIDDFGTGYSSLAYLQRLPVELLKVDRTFVRGLTDGGDAIVTAVVELAKALSLRVVAEGVEYQHQLEALTAMRCAYAQGYFLARPMSAAALADHLVAAMTRVATPPFGERAG